MSACIPELTPTKSLNPANNQYVKMLLEDFADRAFDEEKAIEFKGKWKQVLTGKTYDKVDLEIGTGNGYHFANRSSKDTERLLLGIEIKFKPLVQAIRRALKEGAENNAFMMRFNAYQIQRLFEKEEIDNIYIHHPDPWPKKRNWKHRLIQNEYMDKLFEIQKPGSIIEFKTDSKDYFFWSKEIFEKSKYKVIAYTEDLHHSEFADQNFVTHFETIFLRKGQPIYYTQLLKEQKN